MEREILSPEKSKERELPEIGRFELDPRQKIDIIVRKAPSIKLPDKLETADCEAIQVVIQKDGKDFFDFNDLSPKETELVLRSEKEEKSKGSKNMWGWVSFDNFDVISVPRVWKGRAKDTLALLHEISHGLDPHSKRRDEMFSYWKSRMEEIIKEGTKERAEELKIATKEYLKLMSQKERFAWAQALSIAKKLKKEYGIDILQPFQGKTPAKTRENLEEYIDGMESLGYYEMYYITRSELGEELKGLFTTKFYKGVKFTPEHRKKIRSRPK